MSPSLIQILFVALIVILLFGASRFGELGKGLATGIRSFKKGLEDEPPTDAKEPKAAVAAKRESRA
jgi:sec-independent protein translocase protein TatA